MGLTTRKEANFHFESAIIYECQGLETEQVVQQYPCTSLSRPVLRRFVDAFRDERIWRTASGKGTNPNHSSITTTLKSWETMILFVLKTVIHWIFGLAVSVLPGNGVIMRPPQIWYLTAVACVLALMGTYISFRRKGGPQPAIYGHLQTLVDLVDSWPREGQRMYWGHKSEREDWICHAGTGVRPLKSIKMDCMYMGF